MISEITFRRRASKLLQRWGRGGSVRVRLSGLMSLPNGIRPSRAVSMGVRATHERIIDDITGPG